VFLSPCQQKPCRARKDEERGRLRDYRGWRRVEPNQSRGEEGEGDKEGGFLLLLLPLGGGLLQGWGRGEELRIGKK
jgi:hypothetical protein